MFSTFAFVNIIAIISAIITLVLVVGGISEDSAMSYVKMQ